VLWTDDIANAAGEQQLLDHARRAGCNAVAIRTTSSRLPGAIPRLHAQGIKVFAWRWPARRTTKSPPNYFALDQARYIAQTLIPAGLDGFYADIESEEDGAANDWNEAGLEELAREFCSIIRNAAPADFVLSVTAGCRQPSQCKRIPWTQFVNSCDAGMPQAYWRWRNPQTNKGREHQRRHATQRARIGDTGLVRALLKEAADSDSRRTCSSDAPGDRRLWRGGERARGTRTPRLSGQCECFDRQSRGGCGAVEKRCQTSMWQASWTSHVRTSLKGQH
jgi:hypothetical protein